MTLEEMLAQIVARAQRKVECPDGIGKPKAHKNDIGGVCATCHGTGKVPRYASLVEALTVECKGNHWEPMYLTQRKLNCAEAQCPGRVLRTEWHQGALAGVYKQWTNTRPRPSTKASLYILADNLTDCFGQPDCNERATRFVLAFMKEATHATE